MAGKIDKILNLVGNMGYRYIAYRARHEVMRRSGLLKNKFPAAPAFQQYITLKEWKEQPAKFFFEDRESLTFPRNPQPELKLRYDDITSGKLMLFNSVLADLGTNYDWVTNPDSGYKYDVNKHWTEIPDYSKEAGDIKYVWEKSRFSYIYDIIRFDYHFNSDCSEQVFADILSWIKGNPVNCGPNYRCSQEMSLRVLNWTFALYYYRNSAHLTEAVFNQVQYAIYWHLHHVYHNINFSRIAVRNNHAITETLTLYLAGMLYQGMPGAEVWKKKGKAWFEEEIDYQVYDDGTFLQYSMNYHRVVAQLLTWGITIADQNKERFNDVVYRRAKRSFIFLRTCMIDETGHLPNYGANDGALFFRLSSTDYRDYRPQLQALAAVIGTEAKFTSHNEDSLWYGIFENARKTWQPPDGLHTFNEGGYYVIREPQTLTFIKCGGYKDRPSQADNLHIDLWYKGENILPDAGSYKYNTDDATIKYFSGTASHNTVMLGEKDQMLKGGRFIWYFWTQRLEAALTEDDSAYTFKGAISAFTYLNKGIVHRRSVVKKKNQPQWVVTDEVANKPAGLPLTQLWHILSGAQKKVTITAAGANGKALTAITRNGHYSSLYGQKEKSGEIVFSDEGNTITTKIEVTRK
ncbi:MAG: alginate lyase family protein [Taibaiella sp.]|nr:alginate lyase family protein [Taibaiella sp.]